MGVQPQVPELSSSSRIGEIGNEIRRLQDQNASMTTRVRLLAAANGLSMHVRSNLTRVDIGVRDGGEGEIRTHVPELPDHPISSRRRYDRFGTCPQESLQIWAAPRGARILAERC